MPRHLIVMVLLASSLMVAGGCNPFAPALDDLKIDRQALLGDRRTVKGFFEWFRNSYELRDTSLYGQILSPDFRFTSRDFTAANQQYWDRDTEMRITTNMFRQIRSATLVWSWFVNADTVGADTLARVERYFNLTIQSDDQSVFNGTGTAKMLLVRPDKQSPWRVRTWADIRDF